MTVMPKGGADIGTVLSVNPARRELRVTPAPAHDYEYPMLKWISVRLRHGETRRCRVAGIRPYDRGWVLTLVPGVSRDDVALMRGATLTLDEADRHPAPEGFFDVSELTGLQVVGVDGTRHGTIAEAYAQPGNDVMEIDAPDGARILVPLIPQVVVKLDRERGVLLVVNDLNPFAVRDQRRDGKGR